MRVHRQAIQAIRKHPLILCGLLIVSFLARVLAFAPIWCPLVLPSVKPLSVFTSLTMLAAFYLLIVFPVRFAVRRALCRLTADNKSLPGASTYPQLVAAGAVRAGLGLLWSVPFLFGCVQAYLYFFVYDASRYGEAMLHLGSFMQRIFPGVDPQTGGPVLVILFFLLSSGLLAYGWHRGVAYDYLMACGRTAMEGFRLSRRLYKHCRESLWRNAVLHLLLLLPPWIAALAVLHVRGGGLSNALMTVYLALSTGIVMDVPLYVGAGLAFLVFYLPFLPYRKARNAAVINDGEYAS